MALGSTLSPGTLQERGGHSCCGEGLYLLPKDWGFTPFSVPQPNACATFNFLTSEKRMVAAGLIPPRGTYMGI